MVGNPITDTYFYVMNYIGEGWTAFLILLLLLLLRFFYFIVTGLSLMCSSLIVNILKYYVFPDAPRPWYIFQWVLHEPLHTVADTELLILRSFPSGHAAQCFAMFVCFALLARKKWLSFLWLIFAFSGAFSRVYLSQHWLKDILAGAGIGALFAVVFSYIGRARFGNHPLLHKGLIWFMKTKR